MHHQPLPLLIAGPIVRRATPQQVVLWIATSQPYDFNVYIDTGAHSVPGAELLVAEDKKVSTIQIGESAFVSLIELQIPPQADTSFLLSYDIGLVNTGGVEKRISKLYPEMLYDGASCFTVAIKQQVQSLYHGSCRKPHHPSADALVQMDKKIEESHNNDNLLESRPALLLMTGDQVYTDDVSGPLLQAIHQVSARLGLFSEVIPHPQYKNSSAIHECPASYYQRNQILPHVNSEGRILDQLLGGKKLPIFSSRSADKHLVTLAEMLAMYLLTWSDALWKDVIHNRDLLPSQFHTDFAEEQEEIECFVKGLSRVKRLLAHLPTYMIFDDHDITDDWNLTRGWEDAAYEDALAKRIIGNALISYFVFQGWGNHPEVFHDTFLEQIYACFESLRQTSETGTSPNKDDNLCPQDTLIHTLLQWDQWHYSVPTYPKVVVLDTRTRRWRSETSFSRPSGLMDWEALSELQQELLDEDSVILVSAAPIFGIKFIEVIQRFFTYIGHALLVDAENWMAHPGSASVILNIFLHKRTPKNFIILSGDVHYSFVFDVSIRRRKHSPSIWQITASGIKNQFPSRLLKFFDWFDKWLYTSKSPLNFFTKRRRMKIKARRIGKSKHARLLNQSAIGHLTLDREGKPTSIDLLTAEGHWINFPEREKRRGN